MTRRTPPPDLPSDFYTRKMKRTQPGFRFKRAIYRDSIWTDWPDGMEVGEFVQTPCRMKVKGGIEDVRIYIAKDLVAFVPPLTASERERVEPPRRLARR